MPASPGAESGRFAGPGVVRAAFIIAVFGWGFGYYGPSVFLGTVLARTGWSVSLVAGAVTVHFLSGAVVAAGLPALYARFGLARVTTAGAAVTALGVSGWSLAGQPGTLFAAAVVSGAGWVTMSAVAVNAFVSPWYVRGRPMALARAFNGASVGGIVFAPLWVALIEQLGFRWAAAAVGLPMVLVVSLLSWRWLRLSPAGLGQRPDGDSVAPRAAGGDGGPDAVAVHADDPPAVVAFAGSIWRSRAFVTLALGMTLGLFAQIGIVTHLVGLFTPDFGAQTAGWLLAAATASAIAGRSLATWLVACSGDRRRVAALFYAVQVIGCASLMLSGPGTLGWIVLDTMLIGAGIGNATSLPPLIAQSDFPPDRVSPVVARCVAIAQATYAFAPAGFGALLGLASARGEPIGVGHWSGGFFVAAILVQLLAGGLLLAGRPRGAAGPPSAAQASSPVGRCW